MNKPEAVIVDVDGTLVDVTSTRHHVLGKRKNFHAFHSDTANCPPHDIVIQMCQMHAAAGREIIVVTARKYHWEAMTQDWLYRNLPVRFHGPYMRGDDDNRPDTEIKRQIFKQLSERFTITHAIDDNPKIIALWKELGLEVATVPGWSEEVAAEYTKLAEKQGRIDGLAREVTNKVAKIIEKYDPSGMNDSPQLIAQELAAAGLLRISLTSEEIREEIVRLRQLHDELEGE